MLLYKTQQNRKTFLRGIQREQHTGHKAVANAIH